MASTGNGPAQRPRARASRACSPPTGWFRSMTTGIDEFELGGRLGAGVVETQKPARPTATSAGWVRATPNVANGVAITGCWPAGRSLTPTRWPTTSVKATPRPNPPSWSGWPVVAGRSRSAFRPPRTRPGSTTTRFAGTRPGTCTSPCRWPRPRLPDDPAPRRSKTGSPAGTRDLIPLTINEIRRLFNRVACPVEHALVHVWHWSNWRPRQPGQSARQPLQTSTSQTVVAVLCGGHRLFLPQGGRVVDRPITCALT